jgi:hypothetical protein
MDRCGLTRRLSPHPKSARRSDRVLCASTNRRTFQTFHPFFLYPFTLLIYRSGPLML